MKRLMQSLMVTMPMNVFDEFEKMMVVIMGKVNVEEDSVQAV